MPALLNKSKFGESISGCLPDPIKVPPGSCVKQPTDETGKVPEGGCIYGDGTPGYINNSGKGMSACCVDENIPSKCIASSLGGGEFCQYTKGIDKNNLWRNNQKVTSMSCDQCGSTYMSQIDKKTGKHVCWNLAPNEDSYDPISPLNPCAKNNEVNNSNCLLARSRSNFGSSHSGIPLWVIIVIVLLLLGAVLVLTKKKKKVSFFGKFK
uniref:Uncharacterized protein n=1 Tax=viral metagenome TaxID=1070528 RepID=A0A6C0I854_9ZZZZ